ncbi:hypothetical protein [Calothrix sp. PCC 6303]|uniref:hypothetical protein n=1 Tax=Calothrix sp. PCC 6303 TaxID=1170562 RepID=UPI0002DA1538|nr:hypothetical protein [Calothrix sp. PCC 6303]
MLPHQGFYIPLHSLNIYSQLCSKCDRIISVILSDRLTSYCQRGMTPKNCYAKWEVNHEAIADENGITGKELFDQLVQF